MNIHRIYRVISTPFRRRRMQAFETRFLATQAGPILDVGGTPGNWQLISSRPRVVLLNIYPRVDGLGNNIEYVRGDGCAMPFQDRSFEIAFSNSVIEHLGTKERQTAFANEVRRVGRSYFVQTPNKWFPIEPHYLTPGIHFLPKRWQAALLRNATIWGWITRPDRKKCQDMVTEIRLLESKEFAEMFPEATIQREKFLGLTKSITAVYGALEGGDTEPGSR